MSEAVEFAEPVEDKTEPELRKLAIDIVEGRVFGSWMCDERHIPMVFLVAQLSAPEHWPRNTSQVYEYLNKAVLGSVNGMPIFHSCNILTTNDVAAIQPLVDELVAARKDFVSQSSEKPSA